MPTLITRPGQIEWNGLLLGDGTDYFVQSLAGWRETPGMDVGNENRPMVHGAWPGRVLAQERVVTADLTIAPLDGDTRAAVAALEEATMLSEGGTEYELAVADLQAVPRVAYGQLTRRALPLASGYGQRITGVAVQWNCADPRLYGAAEQAVTTGLPAAGGGLTYPLTYPLDYGAAAGTGTRQAVNAGNVPTSPRLTITGPCTRPSVADQTTGKTLEFDLVLAAGESLVIDCRAGTVAMNGVTDRMYTLTGASVPPEEFDLVPGANDLVFRAVVPDPAALLTVRWRDAWL